MEYDDAFATGDLNSPWIYVEKGENQGAYDIYGKCIIPVIRGFKSINPTYNSKKIEYYECKFGKWNDEDVTISICDASGKVVFTSSKVYKHCYLIRDKSRGKYALAVSGANFFYFVDKCENILWDPHTNLVWCNEWPIKIKTTQNSSKRNLSQVEQSKILFLADWLDGNTEYYAHASDYPKYKIGKSSMSSGGNTGTAQQSEQQQSGGTTTVVVEHHRDPTPLQEWQQCPACYGSGQCSYVKCGGSGWYYIGDRATTCSMCHGSGKCSTCAGRGGQNVTVYR